MHNPWLQAMQAMAAPNLCAPQRSPWAPLMAMAWEPRRNPWLAMGLAFGPMGWLAAMAPQGDEATEQLVEDMPV